MTVWPFWWDWPLIFTGYAKRRMVEREISEVDVRWMFSDATDLEPAARQGRWIASTRHEGEEWRLVLEPKHASRRLVVITMYARRPLQ